MQKFFIRLLLVIIVIVTIDIIVGLFFKRIYQKGYALRDCKMIEYLLHSDNQDDIVIFGSSTGLTDFIPRQIEDSLNCTAVSCAGNGQRIEFYRIMTQLTLDRYSPKLIIYNLGLDELESDSEGNISIMNPYTDFPIVHEILGKQRNGKEKYLLYSNLYKYNTIWFRNILEILTGHASDLVSNKGFLERQPPRIPPKLIDNSNKIVNDKKYVSPIKEQYLKEIIQMLNEKGITMIVHFSPHLELLPNKGNSYAKQRLIDICKQNNVCVIDFSQSDLFFQHAEWFCENVHLNKKGAIEHTTLLIQLLKNMNLP